MRNIAAAKTAAIAATVGFAGLAVFQLLLAVGAPFGGRPGEDLPRDSSRRASASAALSPSSGTLSLLR
jgi:hypothetical protein